MSMFNTLKRLLGFSPELQDTLQQNCFRAKYLVIDLELTGLNPKQDEIVSLAWLPIEEQRIFVGQSEHFINAHVNELKQSPIFHGIDSHALEGGVPLVLALQQLRPLLDKYVLVFHNAELDWLFLKNAFGQFNIPVAATVMVDTMKIEHKRLSLQGQEIGFDDLNLAACRARYSLPEYLTHNALTDALATAELFLAQLNKITSGKGIALRQLV